MFHLFEHLLHGDTPPPVDELIHWGDELSVGNPLLDNQHREIATMLNTLFHHHRHGGAAPDCIRLLRHLRDLVQVHSENEEAILARHRCPTLAQHQEAHRRIETELAALADTLPTMSRTTAELALAAAVRRILIEHILVQDMADRDYMRE